MAKERILQLQFDYYQFITIATNNQGHTLSDQLTIVNFLSYNYFNVLLINYLKCLLQVAGTVSELALVHQLQSQID